MLLTDKYLQNDTRWFPADFLWGVAISAKQAEGSDDRELTVFVFLSAGHVFFLMELIMNLVKKGCSFMIKYLIC